MYNHLHHGYPKSQHYLVMLFTRKSVLRKKSESGSFTGSLQPSIFFFEFETTIVKKDGQTNKATSARDMYRNIYISRPR